METRGGTTLLDWLEKQGVPDGFRRQLPEGWAIEDLIEPAIYCAALNSFLAADEPKLSPADLAQSPMKNSAVKWARRKNVSLPGPVVVAEQLLTMIEARELKLELRKDGAKALVELHAELEVVFGLKSK